jgi:hypothetical protein
MKISDDRGKISDPADKRDISKISNSTGRYFFSLKLISEVSVNIAIGTEGPHIVENL